ncbi:MAG: DUF805 domain-containing protein [Clostridia bacterium]|nr:DUF805 domain-containing protein [Clostridia bacterium]
MNWYIHTIKNYFNFSGRARRKEYWMFSIISAVITLLLSIIDSLIGIQLLTSLYSLFVLIPNLSVSFRRIHDINKSAWWFLISFIPVIGAIVLLIFSFLPGTIGANKYGDDPKDTPAV